MPVGRQELTILVFLVIVLEFVYSCKSEERIAVVHLHTERIQNVGCVLGLLDDCILCLLFLRAGRRKNSEVVFEKALVGSELDHFRVDKHKLELGRMLGIEQGRHYHIKTHGLTLLRGTRNEKVWSLREVKHLNVPRYCAAYGNRQFGLSVAEGVVVEHGLERHYGRLAVGNLDSDGIVKFHDTNSLCAERDSDIALHCLD